MPQDARLARDVESFQATLPFLYRGAARALGDSVIHSQVGKSSIRPTSALRRQPGVRNYGSLATASSLIESRMFAIMASKMHWAVP